MLASWLLAEAPPAVTGGPGGSYAASAAGSVPNGAPTGMDVDAAPTSAHTDGCGAEELRARMEGFLQSMVAGMEVRIACMLDLHFPLGALWRAKVVAVRKVVPRLPCFPPRCALWMSSRA